MINLTAAWIGFALGCISGAIPGLFFQRENWLGGYSSWPRRLIRLAHISFFGIGFLNLGIGLTCKVLDIDAPMASALMIAGAVFMPTICYLSAFRPVFRHLFFIPAGSILVSTILFIGNVDGASCSAQEEPKHISSVLHTLNIRHKQLTLMELEAPSTLTERKVTS